MSKIPPSIPRHQQGVVLLLCLIILVVLLAGGVAVMRSMNASLFSAGNLAFKRDLVNRGELAAADVMTLFKTGALSGASADIANVKAENYSAIQLATNARGIPTALLTNTAYDAIADKKIENTADRITVRYLIDRMCNAAGTPSSLGPKGCVYAPLTTQVTGGSSQRAKEDLPPPSTLIYRLTVRVDGPRDTQVFLQASFTKPDL
ncbi:hypothetical protein [Variovorax sp. JS1663]|uniref:hypothetical protein n=1 Tax=Variovorax sp. JS1663 TaxID=1851577 RepID=UPI00117F01BA|nr:hypothetical protein [Variovorax sp. JS1663]